MKFVTKWLSFITLFAAILVLTSCDKDDPEKSEEEVQLDKLRGTWTLASVVNDGVTRTDEYVDMTISISGTYTEGGAYNMSSQADEWPSLSPWKASDTFRFNTSDINEIIRQSDLQAMDYTLSNSDAQLVIEFDYGGPGFSNGRTASVAGSWVFTFTK